jgi:hypothetical protein
LEIILEILEVTAGLTGVYFYRKQAKSIWFAFAVFLLFLFGMELLGAWFSNNKRYQQNTNLFKWVVEPSLFIMYHIIFYKIVSAKIKPAVIVSGSIFLILTFLENIFWGDIHFYSNSLTMSYGCLVVLLFSMHYFYKLIKGQELLYFNRLMSFWFCLGVFIFFLGSFPYLTFFNSLAISKNQVAAQLYRLVFMFLNWIMYLLFTIGFICSRPKR